MTKETGHLPGLGTWVLSQAAARSHKVLHRRLRDAGFSGFEYRVLVALDDTGCVHQAELGNATALDPRDVTHTVRALEERGLVIRAHDPAHGRRVLVSLSPAGSAAAESLRTVMEEIQMEVFGKLSPVQRDELLALLSRVAR